MLCAVGVRAGQTLNMANPTEFFTNLASRLLKTEMGLDLARIQIYPTNYYTPAVHRLLQVTANLLDSSTNNPYPTIFRPCFISDGSNIFIAGYQLVNGPDSSPTSPTFLRLPIDLNDPSFLGRGRIGRFPTHLNVYGVPWIIGARKGLPNLNEIAMQSVAQITRKLLISRPSLYADFSQYKTTQMYVVGVSNVVGVEVWNSYRTNYPRPVYIQADGVLSMTLTNDAPGFRPISRRYALGGANVVTNMGAISLGSNQWQGTGWMPEQFALPNSQSFQVPLLTNVVFIPDSIYQQNPPALIQVTNIATIWSINLPGPPFPQPLWGLNITNRIRCIILDGGVAGRVIDYVQLDGLNTFRDLAGEIYTSNRLAGVTNMWSTNGPVNGIVGSMPLGLVNQIEISDGDIQSSDSDWANQMLSPPFGVAREFAIDAFRMFLQLQPLFNQDTGNTNLVMQVPFTPTSKKYQPLTWQANDPLVHYTIDDLNHLGVPNTVYSATPPNHVVPSVASNFWRYTDRYDPWGGNPSKGLVDPNLDVNMALKDPMVRASDDWDFPSNAPLSFTALGRIHRGTPWQTIYFKASDITNYITWTKWTGDSVVWSAGSSSIPDASFSRPVMDRDLINVLGPMLSTNNPSQQLSINNPDAGAWLAVLDGIPVLTNSTPVTTLIMSSNSPQASLISQSIANTRSNSVPTRRFAHLGDILATPQLSEQSPFLDRSFLQWPSAGGLSDELVECIPTRLLPLLREDFIGSAVWSGNQFWVQFTGYDGYAYALEGSSNLVDWVTIGIQWPTNGVFSFLAPAPSSTGRQFYRSVLVQ